MKTNAALITNILITITLLSGTILASTLVSADNDSIVDEINITVPVSCTISGTGMNTHNANISNGLYVPDIGTTTLHAFCNDNEGFAIYAAGYTGNEVGGTNSNKLVGTNASGNATIESGTATTAGSPDISNWAMKLAISQDSGDTTGTNAFTIDSAPNVALPSEAESGATQVPFSSYHVVPNEYTKVAHKNSGTDMTETTGGVKLTTTYAAYISKTQAADTYSGQVIYTLVHPANNSAPAPALLDTGRIVNSKIKTIADTYAAVKTIDVHTETATPEGFIPSETNTISASTSKNPIYIIFDNSDNMGIMHFYTEGYQIILPTDSSYMLNQLYGLSDISDISDWDASNVTNMSHMFDDAASDSYSALSLDLSSWDTSNVTDMSSMFAGFAYSAPTLHLDLSSWDTSSVTDMSLMFNAVATNASTWSIAGLSSFDTSSVTNMNSMFSGTGLSTFSLDLSSWNTSNVTDMGSMFDYAGVNADTFTLNLSSWNTSNVTNMDLMFSSAGSSATTWSITIPQTNGNNTNNTTNYFYGQTTTTYATPLSGKSFTLTQL